jgi:hypothetical protein
MCRNQFGNYTICIWVDGLVSVMNRKLGNWVSDSSKNIREQKDKENDQKKCGDFTYHFIGSNFNI